MSHLEKWLEDPENIFDLRLAELSCKVAALLSAEMKMQGIKVKQLAYRSGYRKRTIRKILDGRFDGSLVILVDVFMCLNRELEFHLVIPPISLAWIEDANK